VIDDMIPQPKWPEGHDSNPAISSTPSLPTPASTWPPWHGLPASSYWCENRDKSKNPWPRNNPPPLPHLRRTRPFDGEDFPFCSDRCRKIDLGKWASGVYKISSPILDPEVLEDLGGARTWAQVQIENPTGSAAATPKAADDN
jgi:hypothetical protein